MNFNVTSRLSSLFGYFNYFKRETPTNIKSADRCEEYLAVFLKILSWDEPVLTWTIFLIVNFLFWLVVVLDITLLSSVFVILIILFLIDLYFENIIAGNTAVQNASIEKVRQVREALNVSLSRLKAAREESPSLFCLVFCILFLTLNYIARHLDGHFFTYVVILAVFFTPYFVSLLPPEYLRVFQCDNRNELMAEEEFIPVLPTRDSAVRDFELESTMTDKTSDSVTNSFISGISTMPSYSDDSSEDIEEDLLPEQQHSNDSSDSEVDHNVNLNAARISDDSSSEEEKAFSEGLRIPDKYLDQSDRPSDSIQLPESFGNMLTNLTASLGNQLLANLKSNKVLFTQADQENSSSSCESDFEVVDFKDVKD